MREVLFDENGQTIERSWAERQAAHSSIPERVFHAYAVRHMGFVHARVSETVAYVTLRPSRITRRAAEALEAAMKAAAFDMAMFSVYDEIDWRHELQPSRARALEYVSELKSSAALAALPNSTVRFGVHELVHSHPLSELLRFWKPHATMRDMSRLLKAAEDTCQDRYMIAERRSGEADFIVREGGHGYPRFADTYLETWLGRSVLDHPDKRYGAQCLRSYESAAQSHSPQIEVVDATIYWPLTGPVHRMYTRALLPFTDAAGRTWVMTSSIEGRGVVG